MAGVAQLCAAALAMPLERSGDGRLLTLLGFVLFDVGLSALGRMADCDAMHWPPAIRGVAIMFCLPPPTRQRLRDEAAAAAEVEHPQVPPVARRRIEQRTSATQSRSGVSVGTVQSVSAKARSIGWRHRRNSPRRGIGA